MGWWQRLFRLAEARVSGHVPEPSVVFSHDLSTPTDVVTPTPISDAIKAASNWPVSRRDALSVPAVLRGRNLLCSIATLPLLTRDRARFEVRTPLLEQIDPNVPNVVTLSQTVEDLIFEAISWWKVTERDASGWPRSAVHLDVDTVSLLPPPGAWRTLRTLPSGQQLPAGVVWVQGEPVDGRDMIRFDSPNPGILTAAARAIRRAMLLEQAAATYASDPRPLDYFRPADGADPVDDPEVQAILDQWRAARRKRSTAYVPAALTYETVDVPSPADLQLAQLQKQATVEIANALGLDSEDLQVSTTSRTYANAVDRRRDRINDTLSPYMRAITDRLSMNDITKRGQTVDFDLDDYLRADPMTRWQTYEIGLRNEVVSREEVREEERLPAVPVERSPRPRPQQTPPPIGGRPQETQQEAGMSRTRTARFSESESTRISFDLSSADAQFKVDTEKRTVSGLLVPWNKVARSGFAKWRFAPNSLRWSEVSRIKLNRDHDRRNAVGYALRLESTDAGLTGTFKIGRGPEGDAVLMAAEDKILDGFSIEVDFDPDGTSWARDPDDDMVRLVSDAPLVGVAITPTPAFDDARLTGVTASRNTNRKDSPVGDEPQGTQTQTPAAAPDNTTIQAFTAAVEAFTAQAGAFNDAIAHLVEVQQHGGEGPATVDPTRPTAQFQVNEEPLYRFNGTKGEHDFSSDIIAGAKGDYDAMGRVEKWIGANFTYQPGVHFVNQANVSALNPPRQRPDLYVDQLQYPSPLWDAINKGTIEDNTPFVLPKFQSAGNLVHNHTEGNEPPNGTFTTTTQTITPSPVSGKVEITREAFDQGGNPQLSTILWRQMVRAYTEALEQGAATLLNGLTITEITLTAGAVDKALASEVKQALAALHFVRGGMRFRDFDLAQDLYTALADAKDDNGRPLFPVLGAQNSDGQMGQFFGALSIAGLAGMPSWALPGTVFGTPNTPSKSYLFNREDVHGWASNPQRLEFEYRVAYVDVAIWGYKALACTRTDGVRRINYDDGRTS